MSAATELLIKIKAVESLGGFDALAAKAKQGETAMKGMENVTNASAKKMKTDLEQVNNTRFDAMGNRFKSTITSMTSTAASGARSIKSSLESMVDGVDGAITSVASGMGVMELFDKAMDKALTKTQLRNAKPQDYDTIMSQYQQFTTKSSASDDDISKMLRYTYGGNSNQTYTALNAIDAISYSADKLQRQEGIRGWGTYISGGWSAASGMMRDEPLTGDQVKLLQNAKTYDERIKAMETIAQQKGNLDANGNSLSTTTTGELGKYNVTLAAADSIMRGAVGTFETFMSTIAPVIDDFNNLDPGIKNTLGGLITWGTLLIAGAAGLGIMIKVLSPVAGGLGKIKDALSGAKDVKNGVDKLKDGLSGKDITSTVNIKAANVYVNGKTTGTGPNNTTTTTTTTTTPPPSTWSKITSAGYKIANAGIPLVSGALGSYLATYGLPTTTRLSAVGMSAVGSVSRGLTSFGGSLAIPLAGADLPGNWLYEWRTKGINPIQGASNYVNTSPEWNMVRGQFGNATNPNIKGSLADQLNLPGWLSGASKGPIDYLDSLKNWKMPDLGIDDWFKNATPSQDIANWANTNIGKPVTDTWNNTKTTVMSNPVIGGAITQVSNLLNDPQKAWNDARNYVSHSIIGKAWADASQLYTNVKSWWDAARRYVKEHTISTTADHNEFISGGGGGAFTAGDNADAGYGTGPYYEPVITTPTTTKTTTKQTIIKAPITIESISNREEGDRAIKAITNHLNQFNNANGN